MGTSRFFIFLTGLVGLLVLAGETFAQTESDQNREDFFEQEIRPVLLASCIECHGADSQEADVRVDSREAMLSEHGGGALIVPGDPDRSRLIQVIRYADDDVQMPPTAKLPSKAIEALTHWVATGAYWPETRLLNRTEEASEHWAFQAVKHFDPPAVLRSDWVSNEIDHFILAQLESQHLMPNERAERRTLIRRLSIDLTGLPPTPEEVAEFINDTSPNAVSALIDRLLESPQFGERWGRYWLDIARYADTKGYVFEEDRNYKFAYLFRDWVIRSLNEDLPYDQFLLYQLAGDQWNVSEDKRDLAALGFWTIGRRFLNSQPDIIDDQLDVMSRGMMGLTVSCARCHDHKYDPVPTADYYSLYGVLAASRETYIHLEEPTEDYLKELERRKEAVREYESGDFKQGQLDRLRREVGEWEVSDQAPMRLKVLNDIAEPVGNPRVFLRGNPANPGDEVPRQFVSFLSSGSPKPFASGSGRLEMAQAIVSPENPLTARVWVNRVWGYLIGKGLVATPSDFGLRSEPPSHPELLDYLTETFIADGWSTKKLIRRIVSSSTYQQSSAWRSDAEATDPENQLVWRMNRRRMDLEAMRDNLLTAAGVLDTTLYGKSIDITASPFSTRRTVYSFIDRQNLPGLFRTFDFASPDAHSPGRFMTTVPQQALFLMNHSFVIEMAEHTAARPDIVAETECDHKVSRLYEVLFGRLPNEFELEAARSYWQATTESTGESGDKSDTDSAETAQQKVWTRYIQALFMSNEFTFVD